jgi:hypothetical protein
MGYIIEHFKAIKIWDYVITIAKRPTDQFGKQLLTLNIKEMDTSVTMDVPATAVNPRLVLLTLAYRDRFIIDWDHISRLTDTETILWDQKAQQYIKETDTFPYAHALNDIITTKLPASPMEERNRDVQ